MPTGVSIVERIVLIVKMPLLLVFRSGVVPKLCVCDGAAALEAIFWGRISMNIFIFSYFLH